MKKPTVIFPNDQISIVGKIFDTPVVVKGKTWIPLIQLATWFVMSMVSKTQHPHWQIAEYTGGGAATALAILGSEWSHNVAHAAVARWIGKPMEALRILWGMPLVYYRNINDETVTPRQHIFRALGGPILNGIWVLIATVYKQFTKPNTIARDFANTTIGMNIFSCFAAILPIPGLDGGAILKWALVERGSDIQQADATVKRVNIITGSVLGVAAATSIKKRRWLIGAIFSILAAISLAIGFGWLKEE